MMCETTTATPRMRRESRKSLGLADLRAFAELEFEHQEEDINDKSGGTAYSYGDFKLEGAGSDDKIDPKVIAALRSIQVACDKKARQGPVATATGPARRTRARVGVPRQISWDISREDPDERRGSSSVRSGSFNESFNSSMRRAGATQKDFDFFIDELNRLESATRAKDWMVSFKDLDPRFQILNFFNDLALDGVEQFESNGCRAECATMKPKILRGFIKAGIFSVWRPTSIDAIRKMITGEGTGKGLDIKGKSAKKGEYSGFVPFLQIHDNSHKERVGSMQEDARVRVFYPNHSSRDQVAKILNMLGRAMTKKATIAQEQKMVESSDDQRAQEDIERCLMSDPSVYKIDDYVKPSSIYGLDIPEKLFWEGYVVPNDITREEKYATGRPSMPEFQEMNIETLRKGAGMETGPRPVLWHGGCGRLGEGTPVSYNPLNPVGLLMAYEENNTVKPVVSDFDCFLLGTRGIRYHEPLGDLEKSTLLWCINEIEGVLQTPKTDSNWTSRWLEVKKKNIYNDDLHKEMPAFGFADPRSYSIMKGAVHNLKSNGAVRHGPECFNYGFPQELDEQYLVISDTFSGVPWRYTNAAGLIDILSEKVDQGFTFPLNPKWILCDDGWKKVYDKLMCSTKSNVQDSLRIWYPDNIRERINEISSKYSEGFIDTSDNSNRDNGVQVDLAMLEFFKYKKNIENRVARLRGKLKEKERLSQSKAKNVMESTDEKKVDATNTAVSVGDDNDEAGIKENKRQPQRATLQGESSRQNSGKSTLQRQAGGRSLGKSSLQRKSGSRKLMSDLEK
mmetsp:Transcript_12194/g.25943  ORF Transcript_12194/g.25943 Transcript_12194/m.25943 type:complete len:793 (+) Transcript_12194:69-2447(+)